ncbi:hypothetical protein P5673_002279 [Acropora cervicornis]|uniref:Uncharacterized protein n=1 Tax=Acropora cervicornis TaxID=6130 RepID=A0AAD9R545_ACRCE|nr:hypothetical protein P5673_002279 [Acropora cervicornis]
MCCLSAQIPTSRHELSFVYNSDIEDMEISNQKGSSETKAQRKVNEKLVGATPDKVTSSTKEYDSPHSGSYSYSIQPKS